jgi:signal transduction histidine kinase
MRLRARRLGLLPRAIVLGASVLVCPTVSAQAPPQKTVLTIHWAAEDFPGTDVLDAAIREVLQSQLETPVNYYAEYLESETFPVETASLALRDYIGRKFAGRRIDLVIANTTAAFQFALRFRQDLFAGVPIVFSAGVMPEVTIQRTIAGVTGVVSDPAIAETLELALKLHPAVRRVFVVAQAPGVTGYDERVRAALAPFTPEVELSYVREKSMAGLIAVIKAVPEGSLILYTRYTPAESQRVIYTDEVARLIAQASPVPVYSAAEVYMGTGVVGGMMRPLRANGARLGEIARRILDGTPPESIPIERVQVVPTFDWRQLRRLGINPSDLPAGSDIRFRTPTVWESFRGYIIGAVVVVVTQLLLITALLTQRAHRHQAEKTVLAREATLRTSYERIRQLAGRLINAQEAARADLARDLHDDVCQQLAYVSMGVSSLKGSPGRIQDAETQEAFAELERDTLGMFEEIRRLSHDLHPPTLRLLGLTPALKAHCKEVEKRHDVRVSLNADDGLGPLHPDVAICLFRIAQESLRNGLVHGGARRCAVSLVKAGEFVELTVTDDGRGFDLEAVRRNGSGLGIVSMEERARAIGGHVAIVTAPGRGTTVCVRAPATPPPSDAQADAALGSEPSPVRDRTPAAG